MKKIYFFYPKGERLTGQEMASKLIFQNLSDRWDFKLKIFPAYERVAQSILYLPTYLLKVLKLWLSVAGLVFVRKPLIYINLGQSTASLLRDGMPFVLLSLIRWDLRCVISLHGHVFTTWEEKSFVQKLFKKIVKRAEAVTVLGENQKQSLKNMGVSDQKIYIVNNTCELDALSKVNNKQSKILKVMYLSNLIKSKGYLNYLKALKELSQSKDLKFKIDAILCGKITISGTSDSEENEADSRKTIENLISEINHSENVNVKWIEGAYGAEKNKLFEETDLFVFPSQYPVEAQPIVLIEALASGTAIITSKVGEIESTLRDSGAILLDVPDSQIIADIIKKLDFNKIIEMKKAGLIHFEKFFSHCVYNEKWNNIFGNLAGEVSTGDEAFCKLRDFDNHDFNRGRPFFVEFLWVCFRGLFFRLIYLPIYRCRRILLRFFGASIGRGVIFKPTSKVTFPWRLTVGDNSWIGEEVWILNLFHVTIGDNVVISQRSLLCTGNHDWSKKKFDLIVKPIVIENGVWIGAGVTVLPGIRIGSNSIVTAGSVVTEDLPAGMICSGNPCKPVKPRKFENSNN